MNDRHPPLAGASSSASTGSAGAQRYWAGAALVLLAAVAFSGTSITAVVAYGGGATPLAAITVRFFVAVAVLAAILGLAGVSLRLPRRERRLACALGVLLGAQSYCFYTALDLLPVALTMVIIYTYPLLLGLAAAALGEERMTPALAIGLAAAFAGLVLVFNVSGEGFNWAGAGYALGSCLGWGTLTFLNARLIKGRDARPVTLHMQAVAAAMYGVVCLVAGGATLPATAEGWTGFVALPVFYSIAVVAFFAGLARIGAVRAGFFMNFEPVSSITLAVVVLGQALTWLQAVGAALVIAALFGVRRGG
jgi:drug/metabolite transporter (DMT)-like permease